MVPVLVLETKTFALEFHSLLKDLDPVRWKEEKKQGLKEKIVRLENEVNRLYSELQERASELQVKVKKHSKTPAISEKLHHLSELLTELRNYHFEEKMAKEYLHMHRKRMENGYQDLALTMESYSVKLPEIRPTNYQRSFIHMLSAIISLFLIESAPEPVYLIYLALIFSTSFWSMEIIRRINNKAKEKIMNLFSPISHPHEYYKINSGTWFGTALVILALTQSPMLSAIAVTVLGFSDPAAAIIGRKYGKTKLFGGRSLEGSLTFFIVGTISVFAMLSFLHPIGESWQILVVSIFAAAFGAVGELFGGYPDDNLIVPLSSALGAFFALSIL